MRKPIVLAIAVACISTSVQAQIYYVPVPGEPDRVIRLDIEKAIRRALTLPSRLVSPPSQAGVPVPPQAAPAAPSRAPQETRAQWRQRLFDEMKDYCTQYPDDDACGPNALSGGSGR